jgi:hypothetical protein
VLVLSQRDDKTDAIALYYQESRRAFTVANATLATLTERNVTGANEATQAEAVAYRHARDLIVNAIIVAALLMIAGVLYFVTAVTNPIAELVDRMHRISDNETEIDIPSTERPTKWARSLAPWSGSAITRWRWRKAAPRWPSRPARWKSRWPTSGAWLNCSATSCRWCRTNSAPR